MKLGTFILGGLALALPPLLYAQDRPQIRASEGASVQLTEIPFDKADEIPDAAYGLIANARVGIAKAGIKIAKVRIVHREGHEFHSCHKCHATDAAFSRWGTAFGDHASFFIACLGWLIAASLPFAARK